MVAPVIEDFSDAALVLVGHGSTLNAESAQPTWRHAAALRERGLFGQVLECFWKEHPMIAGVSRGVWARRVFVAPLFISDGYFTEEVIPRELGLKRPGPDPGSRATVRDGRLWHYCEPVGTHPSMTRVILARAAEAVAAGSRSDPPVRPVAETSLFIAGHGTGNNENSRQAIEAQAVRIAAQGTFRDVHAVFMEEEPRLEEVYRLGASDQAVVAPFFISDGLHSYEDIPVLLGEDPEEVRRRLRRGEPTWRNPTLRNGKWVWYARSVGTEPLLADVILDRVREAAASLSGVSPGQSS